MHWHPRRDDAGQRVPIRRPSAPSAPATWSDPQATAVFVPDGPAPAALNGVSMAPWHPLHDDAAWSVLAASMPVTEPPFAWPPGMQPAAGVVVVEPDRRIWLAAPTNGFGGVAHVVPKGRVDAGSTPAAAALREAWEEVGLQVQLTGWLIDVPRSVTFTRYYLGRRVGGSPAVMGWESQGACLCPAARLPKLLDGPHDASLVAAILNKIATS